MSATDISPELVADMATKVADALDQINDDFGRFQGEVFGKLKDSWYNENAVKILPTAATEMNTACKEVNDSLESLGKALAESVRKWSEANSGDASKYLIKSITALPVQLSCDAVEDIDGRKGMDVDVVQEAVRTAGEIKDLMISRLIHLREAGEVQGFRGGNMQFQLNQVCTTLKKQIEDAVGLIVDNITSNTGTAATNVEEAKDETQSTFTIS